MDTQEIQSVEGGNEETKMPAQEEQQPKTEEQELDYVREEAQRKIDAYLANPELDMNAKAALLDDRINKQRGLIEQYRDEERQDVDDIRAEYKRRKEINFQDDNEAWAKKQIAEVKDRYSLWRKEVQAIITTLRQNKEKLTPETPSSTADQPQIESSTQTDELTNPAAAEEPAEAEEPPVAETLIMPEDVAAETSTEEAIQEEKEEPEETKDVLLDQQTITEKMVKNRELAEDLRNISARLRTISTDISPNEPWYRPLQRFNEEYIGKLNNRLLNIIDEAGKLRSVNKAIEDDETNIAQQRLADSSEQLQHNWEMVGAILEDAMHFINRLRNATNELSRDSVDSDHPIWQIGSRLRQASTELENRQRML
ncbi:TPA: hypothetical protein DD449_04330 [Candidatus Berkelbacteria bacterium]|uniref:Uncharacterized protein n=1 Tax=Berkelbacteria bacterium GW2011_GWE1_39_12 TaxID=1618337 RepID=A0A0G4B2X5_9BACT|nr:MAG: hypothetical protein UT28_C0001G0486 [Berkelbacteria bacterium GW2011_GWE1_39_12]HBO60882.1 hypothetical protein [Candidatus Berkelbacteria bacterium]